MANKEIHELINSEGLSDSDVLASQENTGGNVWVTRKFTLSTLGLFLNTLLQYASALHTTNKTVTGAINEIYDSSTSPALDDLSDVDIDSSTLAEGQTILYNATSGKFENGSVSGGSHSYSTTEQVVGTWIDGSHVYEKTIHIQPNGNTQDYTNAEALSGVGVVIASEFLAKRQDSGSVWYYTGNGSTYPESVNYSQYKLGVRVSGGYVQYYINGYDTEITDIWAILKYTKSSS